MTEPGDIELVRKAIPIVEVVDFDMLDEEFSSPEKFRQVVSLLIENNELPILFPSVPDFLKAKNEGLTTNKKYMEKQLNLPPSLYDSGTYDEYPTIRGPIEEIILSYEKEKKKLGLVSIGVSGDGWSANFKNRMKGIHYPKVGRIEQEIEDEIKDMF